MQIQLDRLSRPGKNRAWYRTLSFLLNSEGVAENIHCSSCQQARSQNDWQQTTVAGDKMTWWKKRAIVVVVLNSSGRALLKDFNPLFGYTSSSKTGKDTFSFSRIFLIFLRLWELRTENYVAILIGIGIRFFLAFFNLWIATPQIWFRRHRTHPAECEFETPIELNGIFPQMAFLLLLIPQSWFQAEFALGKRTDNGRCFDEQGLQPNWLCSCNSSVFTPSDPKVNWAPKGDDYPHDRLLARGNIILC